MAKLAHKIRIKATRADVFRALSTTQGLTAWYTPHLDANVATGKEVTFRFTGREPFRWKVTELSPTSGVRWECIAGPGAAAGTTVAFRLLDSTDGRTIVECDYENSSDSDDAFATCNTFWGILMGHLRDYVETGVPVPAFR